MSRPLAMSQVGFQEGFAPRCPALGPGNARRRVSGGAGAWEMPAVEMAFESGLLLGRSNLAASTQFGAFLEKLVWNLLTCSFYVSGWTYTRPFLVDDSGVRQKNGELSKGWL